MKSLVVVILFLGDDLGSGIGQGREQKLVSQRPVENLDERILHELS